MELMNFRLDTFYFLVLKKLLVIGNVEINPGPKKGPLNDVPGNVSILDRTLYLNDRFVTYERFLQTSIQDLPNEIDKLCNEKSQLKRKIITECLENKRLKEEVECKDKKINELLSRVENLEKEISNQASGRAHKEEAEEFLQTPVKEMTNMVNKVCKEKHDLKIEVENKNKEIEKLKLEIEKKNDAEAYMASVPLIPGLGDEILTACEYRNWLRCVLLLEEKLDKESISYQQLQNMGEHFQFLPWDIAKKGYLQLLQVLHRNGLSLSIRKNALYNEALLHVAASANQKDIVKFLVTRVDVNVRDSIDETPLHSAARMGHVDIVRMLLENNACIDAVNYVNRTPLHHAVIYSNAPVVEYLVSHNCNKEIVDTNGKTPLDIAVQENCIEIIQILSEN